MLLARLQNRLQERQQLGLLRTLQWQLDEPGSTVLIRRRARSLINFASNDYLGMRGDPALRQAFAQAAQQYGLGAGASHLLGGHHQQHHALEQELAAWTGRQRALLFGSGFQAALGVMSALLQAEDRVVADKLLHASLIDGSKLAGATLRRFAHQDLAHAQELLQQSSAATLLVSESIFSMDGDATNLSEIAALAQAHQATLMIDDAHGIGVLGAAGAGAAGTLSQQQCPILLVTFGKALGSMGAAICGSADLIDALINFARPFIYTTAMPVALAAASRHAVAMAQTQQWRRDALAERIAQFRAGARRLGLQLGNSLHAIQPVFAGARPVTEVSAALELEGFYVPAIRPPTVPPGSARLRLSLSALHSQAMVDKVLDALARQILE